MNNKKDKIYGSLIGGAIGDALGYQIEFKKNVKDKEITSFKDGKGIISDDTQMTLFTANALLYRETRFAIKGIALLPIDAIFKSYLDWLDTQNHTNNHDSISWIKDLKELNIPQTPGNTCISALSSGIKGTIENPINNSKGCGGIMRVAPIGLYIKEAEIAGQLGAEASAITHGHPLGIIPSYVFSTLIWYLSNTNLTIKEALDKAMKQYEEKFNIFDKENKYYFIDLVNKAVKLSKENKTDIEAIDELGEGWVAEETFAIAIYSCLKYPNNFKDAIVCSINHAGDSDSTGAITGNIMGAYLGYEKIPFEYKNNIELKDEILELANDLSSEIPIGEYNDNNDEYWLSKYFYCKRDISLLNKNEFLNPQDKDIQQIENNAARIMNYRMHAEQLFIPVLNDFQIQDDNNPQTILLATGHGFTEQLTSDGYIENEEFEKRIDLVITNTKQFMKNNGCENVDSSFIYYKDYSNKIFNFKLYVQDIIIPIQNEKR